MTADDDGECLATVGVSRYPSLGSSSSPLAGAGSERIFAAITGYRTPCFVRFVVQFKSSASSDAPDEAVCLCFVPSAVQYRSNF